MIKHIMISTYALLAGQLYAQSPTFELHYAYDFSEGDPAEAVALENIENAIEFKGGIVLDSTNASALSYVPDSSTLSGSGSAMDVSNASFELSEMLVNTSTGYLIFCQFNLLDYLSSDPNITHQIMSIGLGKDVWGISISKSQLYITGVDSGDMTLDLLSDSSGEWMTLVLRNGAALTGDSNEFRVNLYDQDTTELASGIFETKSKNPKLDTIIFGGNDSQMHLDNIAIYDGVLEDTQYQSLVSQTSSGSIPTEFIAVPEPSSALIATLSLLTALGRRRRSSHT